VETGENIMMQATSPQGGATLQPESRPLWRSPFASLRTRLITFFLVVALLPLGAQASFSYRSSHEIMTTEAQQHLLSGAEATAARLDYFIDQTLTELEVFSLIPDLADALRLPADQLANSPSEQHSKIILGQLRRTDETHIASYALLDRAGKNLIDTLPSNIGRDEAQRSYAQAILSQGMARYVSPVEFSETAAQPLLHFSTPVRDADGTIIGVLRVSYKATILQEMVAASNGVAGEQSFAVLLDENHIRLAHGAAAELNFTSIIPLDPASLTALQAAHRLPPSTAETRPTNQPAFEAALANRATNPFITTPLDSAGGQPGEGAVVALKTQPWLVAVFQPQAVFLAPINAQAQIGLFRMLLAMAVIVVSAVFGGQHLTQPLIQLAALTRRFTAGDLTVRAPQTSADEIGTLAASFNAMAAQVGSLLTGYQERTRELEASARITFAATEHKDPEDLGRMVVNLIRDQFDLYHVQAYMLDEQQQAAVLNDSTGYVGYQLLQQGHKIPLDQPSLVTQAIKQDKPVMVADVTTEPNFLPNPLLPETRSELVIPLRSNGKVIGALDVQSRTPDRFAPSTTTLLQSMCEQLSFLFENNELLGRVSKQAETLARFANQLRTAAEMAERLSEIHDTETLLRQAVTLTQSRFQLYHVHIYLLDPSGRQLVVREGSGEAGQILRESGHSIPLDGERSLVARAARTAKPVLVADVSTEPGFLPNPLLPDTCSEVAVPLLARGTLLGVLDVQDTQPQRFGQTDLDTLSTLAGQIATALHNATLFEQHKRAEQAARAAEAKYHTLVDQSLVGTYIIQQGKLTYVNPRLAQILGYSQEELSGKSFMEVVAPESRELVIEKVHQREQGELQGAHYTFQGLRQDGTIIDLEVFGSRIELDGQYALMGGILDITERRQAELALAESQERLNSILSTLDDVVWSLSLAEQKIIYLTPAFATIYGRPNQDFLDNVNLWQEMIHPEDQALVQSPDLFEKGFQASEWRIVRPDGSIRWVFSRVWVVCDANRLPIRLDGITTDITERKQAEEERAHFTAELRTAADVAEQVNAILEPDPLLQQVVTLVHDRFDLYHVHVYLLDELTSLLQMQAGSGEIGQQLRAHSHHIPLDREQSLVARAARTKELIYVGDVRDEPNFMPNPLLPETRCEVAVPLVVGNRVLGVLDVQDNRPQHFSESDLDVFRTLAGQIATALENAHLFAHEQLILEETRLSFDVSQALARARTEDQVLDVLIEQARRLPEGLVSISLLDPLAAEPTFILRRTMLPIPDPSASPIGTQMPVSQVPLAQYLGPDKSFVSSDVQNDERLDEFSRSMLLAMGAGSVAALPLAVGDHWLGGLVLMSPTSGYFDDHNKLHLYQTLAEQGSVALRAAQLFDETQRTAERLREVDRLKSEFLANMSHELRTPLNSIIGYSEVMLMNFEEDLAASAEERQDIQAIYENGQHLLRLINDILDLAKIEAGRLSLEKEDVSIPAVIDSIQVATAGLFNQKPITLVTEIEHGLPMIQADLLRLTQILINLIANAVKFTNEGNIYLRAYRTETALHIEVQDSGIGISEKSLGIIFESFRQADGSNKRRAGGTGLGLAITRHLVHLHGGTIEVHSEVGKGSTFTIKLPLNLEYEAALAMLELSQ
jgi:PAS domain S-box-containing protein